MGSGLVKMVDPVGAIFYSHSRDSVELGIDEWVEIDHIVLQLSLEIESHIYGHSFYRVGSLVDG